MDEAVALIGGMVIFFAILIGGTMYGDHLKHIERMECIKARGDYVEKSCIFRDHKPQ